MDSEQQDKVDIDILNSLPLDFDTPLTAKAKSKDEAEESDSEQEKLDANSAAFVLAEYWASSDTDSQIEEEETSEVESNEADVDEKKDIELIDEGLPTQEEFNAERQKMLEEEEKKRISRSVLENERFINTANTKFQLEAEVEVAEKLDKEEKTPAPKKETTTQQSVNKTTNLLKSLVPKDFIAPVKLNSMSSGAYLRSVREKLNLTIQQIEDESKISKRYIESLENDDMSDMPPAVYVIAHIRKLGVLYHIDNESQEAMCNDLKAQLIHDVPEAVVSSVEQGMEVTEESKREMRKLLWGLISIIAGIILFVIIIGVWIFSGSDSTETPQTVVLESQNIENATVDNQTLVDLLPAPVLKIQELPVKNQ